MLRSFVVCLLALTIAACSGTDKSSPEDTGSSRTDTGTASDDMGTSNSLDSGSDESDGSQSEDDGGGADEDSGGMDPDSGTPDTGGDADTPEMGDNPDDLYVGSGDPYAMGPLTLERVELVASDQGAPKDLLVVAPQMSGRYAVVVLQHGFTLPNTVYETIMEHLASHGFIVVAPQMYSPMFGSAPETAVEAQEAMAVWDWLATGLDAEVTGTPVVDRLGLAGHSRGAKVIWLAMESGYTGATALAGLDPVDGTGGPLGNEPRVLEGGLDSTEPALILGTGLGPTSGLFGMPCAPEGDNHVNFWEALGAPAYHVVAPDYGHNDLLDEDTSECSFCGLCESGPDDGGLRDLTTGMVTAFFRFTLQDVAGDESTLADVAGAPIDVELEQK